MLDFVLSKMTWLVTSILIMSFVIGFFQVQTDSIDENLLQGATQEVNRVIKRLDGINGEMTVNFTFDRYYSYRAFYLPGKVDGDIYKFTFYESYMRATSGDMDIPMRFGTNIQPLQIGNQTNVDLEELLENPQNSYVNKLSLYSNQDFGVASRYVEIEGKMTYKVFVFMFTDIVFYSPDDDEGKQLLYGNSEAPSISDVSDDPDPQILDKRVNITVDVEGDNIRRVFCSLTDPDGEKITTTMLKGPGLQYYHETTYTMVGEYSYKVWATDIFDRIDFTDDYTITIKDIEPPDLSNVRINKNPQESGENIIFYVDVLDDHEVAEVYINITSPAGTKSRHMTHTTGKEWTYSETIIPTGTYSYVFSAIDPSGNWGVTSPYNFIIEDTTPPVISGVSASPNPGTVNETVTFSATVTDLNGVEYVRLVISGVEFEMNLVSGDLYSIDMTFSSAGTVIYKIIARDIPDNVSESPQYFIIIS